MALKEKLELLRGEPIQVFAGDPMDIPCIETSDPEKLCKNPVVSVHMTTYNHEPYIRQAIEGVMMQETDFDFELVIGEDCSTDNTREICFEYQKRYPEKIRVLWWHENVSKLGGNAVRNKARCRGEYLAYCEGDDYWTDRGKLQTQVNALRKHTQAVMCVADCMVCKPDGSQEVLSYGGDTRLLQYRDIEGVYFHTTTYVVRMSAYRAMIAQYSGIVCWYDEIQLRCLASLGQVVYVPKSVSVYRWTGLGAGGSIGSKRRIMLFLDEYLELAFEGPIVSRNRCLVSLLQNLIFYALPYTSCAFSSADRNRFWSLAKILLKSVSPKKFLIRIFYGVASRLLHKCVASVPGIKYIKRKVFCHGA